MRQLV